MEKQIETAFVDNGMDMTVLTPYPTRGCTKTVREAYKGIELLHDHHVKINRFPLMPEPKNTILRAIRYILGNFIQYHYAIKEKNCDVIFAGTTPPTQIILAKRVANKLCKPYVLRVQDIFPDSLVTAGLVKKGSLIYKLGDRMVMRSYREASQIMVVGDEMRNTLEEKGVDKSKIRVVRNWIDLSDVKHINRADNRLMTELGLSKNAFYVVYAGNLGKVQNVSTLVKAAALLQDIDNIQFVVFGNGVESERVVALAQELKLTNIVFYPLQDKTRVSEVYSIADISVIMCQKGAGGSAVPSKTWSILATETPVIAAFDKDSELSELIRTERCGICVEPENEVMLAEAIREAYMKPDLLKDSGKRGRDYINKHISSEVCIKEYIEIVKYSAKLNYVTESG
ncbi:MAG: glycosyltransferase family 4 protein [Clostridia bacterium]|nr:glycosyltransferase family 4 protein [Clostridia bacterium]